MAGSAIPGTTPATPPVTPPGSDGTGVLSLKV